MLGGLVSGLFWFASFVIGHALIFHYRPRPRRAGVLGMTWGVAVVGHALTALQVVHRTDRFGAAAHGGVVVVTGTGVLELIALTMFYLPFYYTVNTSLSLQTIIRIGRAPGRRLLATLIYHSLTSEELVRGRLETLAASGYLSCERGCYVVTRKGRRLALFFKMVRQIWRLGPGG